MRYILALSYDGSAFCGWQIQPASPSVQETLEKALSTLLREPVSVTGAGRTDTGVHAWSYIAHFDTSQPIPFEPRDFVYKLNAITPREIVILSLFPTREDFHARFDARARSYTYFLHKMEDPFIRNRSYLYKGPLDFGRMNEAASLLIGQRDFSCFEKSGGNNKTSICTVSEAYWAPYEPEYIRIFGSEATREGQYWYFRVTADRFLRNMVRAIVGTLLEIGRGRQSPEWLASLLESGARSDAGESVPGHALFLSKIQYPSLK